MTVGKRGTSKKKRIHIYRNLNISKGPANFNIYFCLTALFLEKQRGKKQQDFSCILSTTVLLSLAQYHCSMFLSFSPVKKNGM